MLSVSGLYTSLILTNFTNMGPHEFLKKEMRKNHFFKALVMPSRPLLRSSTACSDGNVSNTCESPNLTLEEETVIVFNEECKIAGFIKSKLFSHKVCH